ncbi:MAG: MBL fold metallo-hydrolase [Chloroflexota bacterium]|nr:MBL fold metallo-hydrolase [Chloroflexota bacterium]
MKLTVFPSNKGDCLLVSGGRGGQILVDGGMIGSYRDYVAPGLGELQARGEHLDLVCVTHIDDDHISGIVRLMDDLRAWRVYDYQSRPETENPQPRPPKSPRPPEVEAVWHNGFESQVGRGASEIAAMLSATTTILAGSDDERIRDLVLEQRAIVTGIPQAETLAQRLAADQLDIPLNPHYDGKMVSLDARKRPTRVGSLRITVIGPTKTRLTELRRHWKKWLEENRARLARIEEEARDNRLPPVTGAFSNAAQLIQPMLAQARALAAAGEVTVPNLASVMMLVEEEDRSLLLTGDGIGEDVLTGLRRVRKLNRQGRIHVDVLKVQHHGAVANITPAFCRAVTADHYVFCGNGAHHNPEPEVVSMIVAARLDPATPHGDRQFKLWFNSSGTFGGTELQQKHMRRIEADVRRLAATADGRMEFAFITDEEWRDRHRFELTFAD